MLKTSKAVCLAAMEKQKGPVLCQYSKYLTYLLVISAFVFAGVLKPMYHYRSRSGESDDCLAVFKVIV